MSNYKDLPKGFHKVGVLDNESSTMVPIQQCPVPMPMQSIQSAGVTLGQAHELNYMLCKQRLSLSELAQKEEIKFQYWLMKEQYKANSVNSNSSNDMVIPITGEEQSVGYKQLIDDFIQKYHIIKETAFNGKFETRFLLREQDSLSHEHFEEKRLQYLFYDYLEDINESIIDENSTLVGRLFDKLKRAIPRLQNTNYDVLPDTYLVFNNGILDVQENKFTHGLSDNRFNRFALEMDYLDKVAAPEAFDALLNDIFRNHPEWKKLCYQIIGALLTPVSTLKKIYLFQGVSGAGKTRLSNIIMRLLSSRQILYMNTISDITSDAVDSNQQDCRLLYIKEAANKRLLPKQICYLKGYADGGGVACLSANFKLLVGTNYKVTTGDDDSLEPALQNRFLVLPFTDAMKNTDPKVCSFEDMSFEKEKGLIVRKALAAFSEVLQSNGKFCLEPEINVYIDGNKDKDCPDEDILNQLIEENFEPSNEIDENMTAQRIFDILQNKKPKIVEGKTSSSIMRVINSHFGPIAKGRGANGMMYALKVKESTNP